MECNTLSDGDYQLNCEWDVIAEIQRSLRDGGAPALWGVGATVGRATLFGRPRSFDGRSVRSPAQPDRADPFAYRYSARESISRELRSSTVCRWQTSIHDASKRANRDFNGPPSITT